MEAPILLSSDISSLATGQTQEFPTQPMQNPFRRPMWLDEIRVQIPRTSSNTVAWYAKIRLEAFLGRVPLTNGFIPVGNLSILTASSDVDYYTFLWKLPKPMYVPGTELVSLRARNVAILGDSSATRVSAALVGRSIDGKFKPPAVTCVPWAAFWEPGRAGYGLSQSGDTFYDSTESDLGNPFDYEMKVQRFIGRGAADELGLSNINGDFTTTTAGLVDVQASDSFGRIMARDPIPYTSMFFYGDHAWTVNAKLQPKGFFLFRIINGLPAAAYASNQWIGVSMIGHREIKMNGGL